MLSVTGIAVAGRCPHRQRRSRGHAAGSTPVSMAGFMLVMAQLPLVLEFDGEALRVAFGTGQMLSGPYDSG